MYNDSCTALLITTTSSFAGWLVVLISRLSVMENIETRRPQGQEGRKAGEGDPKGWSDFLLFPFILVKE